MLKMAVNEGPPLVSPSVTVASPTPADPLFDAHRTGDLKRKSVQGGLVTALSQGSRFFLHLASTAVLARILTPQHFGWISMVTAVTGALIILRDAGLSTATVQRDVISREQVSTLFWINATLGLLLAVATVALAPLIAWFYNEPKLQTITAALALTSVFSGLAAQHQALLRRQMRLAAVAVVDMISLVVGVATGITMAMMGWEYWALVGMQISQAAATLVGSWVAVPWMPGLPGRSSGIKSLLRFGGFLTGSNLMNYLFRNADNVLVGWQWGAGPLGLYSKAYGLLMLPISQINSPVSGVAIPTLSRLQHDPERFRRYFLGGYTVVASAIFPVVVASTVFADEAVRVLLGPNWGEAVALFRWLAPAALIGALLNPFGWLFVAMGRPDRQFKLGIVWSSLIVASFAAGLPFGPKGVAIGYSVMSALLAIPLCRYSIKGTQVRMSDLWQAVQAPLLAALVAGAVGLLIKLALPEMVPPIVRALIGGTLLLAAYGLFLAVVLRKWDFYRGLLRELFPTRFAARPASDIRPPTSDL